MQSLVPKIIWLLAAVVLAVGPAPVVIAGVLAIAAPDSSIVLETVRGYTGVLEPDDLLITVKYDIPYASLPTEPVTDAYIARFLRDTTDLNNTEIFSFNDKGYNTGVLSFYWTALQRTTDSVEHNNPNSENYRVKLQGKPGVFPGAVPTQETGAITWRTRLELRPDIIELALELDRDAAWTANSQDLITTGDQTLFTTGGDEYFATVIPRLAGMEPSLFTSAVTSLPPITRVPPETYSNELNDYWDGTLLDDRINSIASNNGTSPILVKSIISMVIMLFIVVAVARFTRPTPKANEMGLMTLVVTAPLAGAVNFLALPVVLIAGLMGATGIAWAAFGRRGG